MISLSFLRPGLLVLLVVAVPLFCLGWRRWPPPLPPGRSRISLALRLALVSLVVLAIAGLQLSRAPDRRATIAVVDLSDSASASSGEAEKAVRAMQAAKGPDDLFGLVTFGRNAQVEVPPAKRPTFDGFQTRPDGGHSDLAGALQLAANLIPSGYARQLVLVSDGRQNLGDAVEAASGLRQRGVRVDLLPIGRAPGAEALVVALEASQELRVGEAVTATARLRSVGPARGTIRFQVDGAAAETREVEVPAGDSTQALSLPPLPVGVHRLAASLEVTPDGYSQNNTAEAVVRVVGPPSVLVLEGAPGAGRNVAAAVVAAGMQPQVRRVEDAPGDVGGLTGYDATVVVDAPAESFPPGAMQAIATSVRDLGRGFVAIGGTRSYGPGSWRGTPLEEALPVRMEVPQSKERPAVAVVLVLDTLESPQGDAIALGTANSVIDELRPDDEVAVIAMGYEGRQGAADPSQIAVPLTRPTDKAAIKKTIFTTALGDPPGYGKALELAYKTLAASTAATKHVIIMSDGDALGDLGDYDPLFARGQAGRVITSAVGINTHDDATFMDHMRNIGQRGGGIFYLAKTSSDVPKILLESSRAALRPWFEQQPFFPQVTSAGELLDGVPLDAFPQLGGYVATTPKPTADVLLSSPKGDPILAAGQHGLGRSVAWTSDAVGRWTGGFLASGVSATLFGRMVAWSLPTTTSGSLAIDATARGTGLEVTVTSTGPGGDLSVQAVAPDQSTATSTLRSVAPGRWQGLVPADQLGTYVLHAQLERSGAVVGQGELSVPLPYSPEYLELGRDDGLLGAVAAEGGTVLARPEAAWAQRNLPIKVTGLVSFLLLVAVAVLWPVDVALRRLTSSPRALGAAVRQAARRRARPAEEQAPASTARLQAGVEATRRSPPKPPVGGTAAPTAAPPAPVRTTPVNEAAPAQTAPDRTAESALAEPAADAEHDLSSRLLDAKREREGRRPVDPPP